MRRRRPSASRRWASSRRCRTVRCADTFDKYWENSTKRRAPGAVWDAYTPYELRTVGTFVRLGEKQRALSMLDFFFEGQRPQAWRDWAEVVWHDRDTPKFIGDMPHTWVGSDYIRSVLDMFAYDRASDSALVVGAGIAEKWVREAPGVKVRALGTPYGPIDFDIRATGKTLVAHLGGGVHGCRRAASCFARRSMRRSRARVWMELRYHHRPPERWWFATCLRRSP